MLTITPIAAAALTSVREETGAPDTHAVRFSVESEQATKEGRLTMAFVPSPQPGDVVAEQDGLTSYVAPEVDHLVGDAVVDVTEEDGRSTLVLRQTPTEGSA